MANKASWLSDSQDEVPSPASSGAGNAPSWAQSESSSSGTKAAVTEPKKASGESSEANGWVKFTLALINIGMAVFVSFTGAMSIKFSTNKNRVFVIVADVGPELCDPIDISMCATAKDDVGNVFVGIYMVLFSLVLFFFELGHLLSITFLNNMMTRNFGFLNGMHGKCMYIVFMAILVFGLTQPKTLATACGITVGSWAPVQTLLYLKWPKQFPKLEKFDPATATDV
jgi:hypothetical protein